MRTLVYDFLYSEAHVQSAAAVLREHGAEIVGWLGRPHVGERITGHLPGVRFLPVPHPMRDLPLVDAKRIWEIAHVPTLFMLVERERKTGTNLGDVLEITRIYCHVVAVLDELRPELIVACDVPHNVFSYMLYVEARHRGIPMPFVKWGPMPHIVAVGMDLERGISDAFDAGRESPALVLSPTTQALLGRYRSDYKQATPSYMKDQKRNDRFLAYARKVLAAPGRYAQDYRFLRGGVAVAARRRLAAAYERVAVPFDASRGRAVCLFLHLQPERTSCPEGGIFAQQWLIAQTLSRLLPDHRILVREHPSTFRPGPKLLREVNDYQRFLEIPRVELLTLSGSPFEVTDFVDAVVTITGTVGMEALARGTPAIAFGSAAFVDCDGAFDARDPDQLAEAVTWVQERRRVPEGAVETYLSILEGSPHVYVCDHEDVIERFFDLASEGLLRSPVLAR
ncbi:MAG: hypothetical protein KC656_24025, partial [Myxococcales bacterium]|nr:hypothetical protein [Myxococcales bacterium]